jgi:hypothetical protein
VQLHNAHYITLVQDSNSFTSYEVNPAVGSFVAEVPDRAIGDIGDGSEADIYNHPIDDIPDHSTVNPGVADYHDIPASDSDNCAIAVGKISAVMNTNTCSAGRATANNPRSGTTFMADPS